MGELDGKVAIVTGAAQGIGRAIAEGLSAAGARIVVADLNGAEDAAAAFPNGVGLTVDVSNETDVQRLADETVERCGSIDVSSSTTPASTPRSRCDRSRRSRWTNGGR